MRNMAGRVVKSSEGQVGRTRGVPAGRLYGAARRVKHGCSRLFHSLAKNERYDLNSY